MGVKITKKRALYSYRKDDVIYAMSKGEAYDKNHI